MKFYIKQKVFSFKDQFTIKDVEGNDLYKVEGKVFSLKNKLVLQDMEERVIMKAEKKLFRLLQEYTLFSINDEEVATVKRKFALKPKFSVTVNGRELTVNGSFFQHSFEIIQDERIIAAFSKKVISWGDSYEIDIIDESHLELNLFIVVIIDQIIHEQQNRSNN